MKFVLVFLMSSMVHLHLSAQVSVEGTNLPIERVFESIHKQTGYQFVYNHRILKDAKRVNLHFRDAPVNAVLNQSFEGQPFTYSIVDNAIIVRKKLNEIAVAMQPVAIAADRRIRGTITDGVSGRPIAGASVVVKETGRGTTTDEQGNFAMNVPEGNKPVVLVVSSVGYERREITVAANQSSVNVKMKSIDTGLDEVVVTGYTTQTKRTITGAMSSIKGEDIENMAVQSFDQAMQGRMAGVLIQGGSGVPGGPTNVVIRGHGSISAGTEPLYIVDGVEVNTSDSPSDVVASNPLAYLDPNEIESIEVLKDAAAASIYGAQAGNGVVLITTKKGQAGKTRFSLGYYHGITAPMASIDVLNTQEYLSSRMEALANANPELSPAAIRTEVLMQSQLPVNLTDAQIAKLPSYDWQNEAFVTGTTDNASLAVSGGTGKTTFRLSTSLNNTEGTVIGNDFLRASSYLRVGHDISKKVSIWSSINLSWLKRNGSYTSYRSGAYFPAPQYSAPYMLPFLPIYDDEGNFNVPPKGEQFPGNLPYNAIQITNMNTQRADTRNLSGNFRLTYKVMPGLDFVSNYSVYFRNYDTRVYVDPRTQPGYARRGQLSISNQGASTFSTTQTLTYNKRLMGGHRINTLMGVEYYGYNRQRSNSSGEGFPSHEFRTLASAATILNASETHLEYKRAGIFGQLSYDYMSRYMLSGVLRYDGSSRFGADNLFGWFPAISAGWDIASENFLRRSSWIHQLKLRASYGATGNSSITAHAAKALYRGTGSYGNKPGIQLYQLGNPDLRWEKNVEGNIGVDYSFFNRRLSGAIDVFHRRSADLLLRRPLPWSSGYSSVFQNVGEVVNKGLEIQVSTVNIKTRDFEWSSDFNITFQKNKVTKLYVEVSTDDEEEESMDDVLALPGLSSVRLGYPLQTNFRSQYAGVNPATGRPMWWYGEEKISYDPGGQGSTSYTPYGRGNRLSDYYGGFANTIRYKRVELGVFFQYDMGRELYNSTNTRWYEAGSLQQNSTQRAYDLRWTHPGQMTAFPRPIDGSAELLAKKANISSSRYLEDASYIRLKRMSLNYNLPKQFLQKFSLSSAKVYAEAVNLATFTKWTGYDPEFYIMDDSNFESNLGQIPQARAYTIGVSLNF